MRNGENNSQHRSQTLVLGSTKESCKKHPKRMQVQLWPVQVLQRKTYQDKHSASNHNKWFGNFLHCHLLLSQISISSQFIAFSYQREGKVPKIQILKGVKAEIMNYKDGDKIQRPVTDCSGWLLELMKGLYVIF